MPRRRILPPPSRASVAAAFLGEEEGAGQCSASSANPGHAVAILAGTDASFAEALNICDAARPPDAGRTSADVMLGVQIDARFLLEDLRATPGVTGLRSNLAEAEIHVVRNGAMIDRGAMLARISRSTAFEV